MTDTYTSPHTTCSTVNEVGERIDSDGSHCVRCSCSQCLDDECEDDRIVMAMHMLEDEGA